MDQRERNFLVRYGAYASVCDEFGLNKDGDLCLYRKGEEKFKVHTSQNEEEVLEKLADCLWEQFVADGEIDLKLKLQHGTEFGEITFFTTVTLAGNARKYRSK